MSHIRSSPSNPVGFDTNGFIESLFFQVRQLKTQASNLHAENQRLHQILVELDLQVKFERGKYAKLVTTVEGTVFSITSRLGNLARQTCAEFAQPQSQGLASVASMNGGQMDEQENETPSHTNLSVTPEMGFEVSSSPESINSGEQKVQSSPSTSQMGMDVDVSEGPPAVKRSRHGGKAKAMAPLIAEVVHKLEGSNGSDRAAGKRRGKQRANFVKNLGRGLEENAQGEQLPEELLVDIDSRPSSHGFLESTDGPPAATLPRIVVLDFDLEEGPNQGRQFTSSPLPRHLSPRNSDMHEDLINFSAGEEDPMASNRLSIATDVTDLDLQTLADRKEEPFPTIPAISLEAYNSVLGNHTSGSADRNHDQRSQPNESLVDLETDDWFVDDRSESSDRDLIVDVDELGEGDALPGDDDEDNDGGEDEGDDEADDKFRRWTPPRGPGSRGVDALPHRRVPVEPLRRTAPEIQRSAVHERWLHRSPIATASLLDSTMRSDRLLSPIHELQGTPAPSNVAPSRRNVQASGNLEVPSRTQPYPRSRRLNSHSHMRPRTSMPSSTRPTGPPRFYPVAQPPSSDSSWVTSISTETNNISVRSFSHHSISSNFRSPTGRELQINVEQMSRSSSLMGDVQSALSSSRPTSSTPGGENCPLNSRQLPFSRTLLAAAKTLRQTSS